MADPKRPHEYTPEELKESLSTFDPQALGGQAPSEQPGPANPDTGGPPPENTPEQTRLSEKASSFHNDPERSRDDHLTHVGRGHQTHG